MIDFIYIPQLASERSENEKRFFEHCERGYSLDPNNPDAISLKGISFYLKHDPERMVEFIKKALESNPNHPRSLEMYSIQLQREGDFNQAIEVIKRAMEIDPVSRGELESWLVFCHIGKKDWASATISIDRCIETLIKR